ncbi:MAG: dTMP kinase [Planctomycetota bacterium]
MDSKFAGKFIVLDGPDGCGKSTHCKLLTEWLVKQGVDVEVFRDPGDTAIGDKIRQILLNPENILMDTTTEIMLFMASRVQLWNERIAPALVDDKCVVVDRWLSSTCAYQGKAGGFGVDKIIQIAESCLEKPWPDLTVILDIDLQIATQRLSRDLDRMEQKGQEYHQKVRQGFLELAERLEGFAVVDTSGEVESVSKKVIEVVKNNI